MIKKIKWDKYNMELSNKMSNLSDQDLFELAKKFGVNNIIKPPYVWEEKLSLAVKLMEKLDFKELENEIKKLKELQDKNGKHI